MELTCSARLSLCQIPQRNRLRLAISAGRLTAPGTFLTKGDHMAAAILTTKNLLKAQLGIPDSVTTFDATLTLIAAAVNLEVENFCNRHFTFQDYIETLFGTDDKDIQLRNHPISYILYSASGRDVAMTITYIGTGQGGVDIPPTDQDMPTDLINLISNGVVTSVVIGATDTLGAIATAIDLLAEWSATVDAVSANFPARALTPRAITNLIQNDQVPIQMAMSALQLTAVNNAPGDYIASRVITESNQSTIMYRGGYQTIPADLQYGATQLGADTFNASLIDGNLKSERIGNYSWARDIALYITEQVAKKFQVFIAYKNFPGA